MESATEGKIEDLLREENCIVTEKYVKGYYSSKMKIIGVVWNGVFTKEQYIEFFNQLLEHASKNLTTGVYIDLRKQGVVPIDARKHFEKVVAPEAAKLGVKKTGVVTDASPFKKYYLNTIIKVTGHPAKVCSTEQEALDYLLL